MAAKACQAPDSISLVLTLTFVPELNHGELTFQTFVNMTLQEQQYHVHGNHCLQC